MTLCLTLKRCGLYPLYGPSKLSLCHRILRRKRKTPATAYARSLKWVWGCLELNPVGFLIHRNLKQLPPLSTVSRRPVVARLC